MSLERRPSWGDLGDGAALQRDQNRPERWAQEEPHEIQEQRQAPSPASRSDEPLAEPQALVAARDSSALGPMDRGTARRSRGGIDALYLALI